MKKNKVIAILLITVLFIVTLSTGVFAYDWNITRFDTVTSSIDGKATNVVGAVISVTRIIALGVAIIMVLVLAMKYMMSAPGDRAEIKKHAVVYVVGALVLFAGTGLLTIIQMFSENINNL